MHLQKRYILFIFYLFICFSFIQGFIDIDLTEGKFSKDFPAQNNITSFKVSQAKNYNYLKVNVEGYGNNENINHVISYYQEEKLKERKQLSQSITKSTIMWLTKDQIQKDFYLTIECAKTPCDYKLDLSGETTAEIYINEQYTYFVTKENQQMNFSLLNFKNEYSFDEKYEYFVGIWAKGNRKINSKLEGGES
jgi:hypothetical protein